LQTLLGSSNLSKFSEEYNTIFAAKERFHTRSSSSLPIPQFDNSSSSVTLCRRALIFLSALSAARSKTSNIAKLPSVAAPKETTTAAANAMISSTERTPGWMVWRNRLSRQTFRSAGETPYFGHPSPLTDIALAAWLFVTEAGSAPPVGTNHTCTRRASTVPAGPLGTEAWQKPDSKPTPFWSAPGALICTC